MDEGARFEMLRLEMVREQLAGRNITDERVLEAMSVIPRHLFVPPEFAARAYEDGPLPIGLDQTISQPFIVALMTQLLALQGPEKVLEIGTGSGYQAAVLSRLAAEVITLERLDALAANARRVLKSLGIENVTVYTMDGSAGWKESGLYDAIIVTAASPGVSRVLASQLSPEGGRLVIPVGGEGRQRLQKIVRRGDRYSRRQTVPVAFVPLRGEKGWREEDWAS